MILTFLGTQPLELTGLPTVMERLSASHAFAGKGTRTELRVVPSVTLAQAEQLRAEGRFDHAIIFDVNPMDLTAEILEDIEELFPEVLLVDHHGLSFVQKPAGKEDTTTSMMLTQLLDPDSRLSRILMSGGRILAITNQMNLDPDGILSRFVLKNPSTALAYMPELIGAAWVTDHSLFGGRRFNDDPEGLTLTEAEMFGYTLLNRILDFLNRLVDQVMASRELVQSRDHIRSIFCGEQPVYGCNVVQDIFNQMAIDMPFMLRSLREYYLTKGIIRPWWVYFERLKAVEKQIMKSLTTDGLIALYRNGERPDFFERVHDWLCCGAPAPYAHVGTPLQLSHSDKTGQTVLSVPWVTQAAHKMAWDLSPIIGILNDEEVVAGTKARWFGRGAVVLRANPKEQSAITPERLMEIVHMCFKRGELTTAK